MTFPSDPVLIARGKYATLGSEKRALLKSIQASCSLLVDQVRLIVMDVEKDVPNDSDHIAAAANLLEQAGNARAELVVVCQQMVALKPEAWGPKDAE